MYLTQMRLDRNNRRTLSALSSPAKFHGAVESAFPGQRQRNLWRVDSRGGQDYLLILSKEKPDLTLAVQQFAPPGETWQTKDYTPLLNRIHQGSRWQFRLCANPTYSVPAGPGQRGRVCAHSTPEHQLAWLEIPGILRPELQALPQIADRMTFLLFPAHAGVILRPR